MQVPELLKNGVALSLESVIPTAPVLVAIGARRRFGMLTQSEVRVVAGAELVRCILAFYFWQSGSPELAGLVYLGLGIAENIHTARKLKKRTHL